MTKYTAEDFANARFAEHPNPETVDAQYAARMNPDPTYPWLLDGVPGNTDIAMAERGWVPVPTKPTITQSEVDRALSWEADEHKRVPPWSFLNRLGIEVIPDPEPTNTDKLEKLIRESGYEVFTLGHLADTRELAEWLNNDGVTAPKED